MVRSFRIAWIALVLAIPLHPASAEGPLPETIRFLGPDGVTLVGYLFRPAAPSGRHPAVVMMHGRAGPYSTLARGEYGAQTLSQRHLMWGRAWSELGFLALLVDGFGPRGYPQGFPRHSYDDRPEVVNEVTVRPRDAYAALGYLQHRPDVDPGRVGLQGWSNGGSATLAAMAERPAAGEPGFRAAVAFYPACGLHGRFTEHYRAAAPVRIFIGDADEEVSPRRCLGFVEIARRDGSDVEITVYPGASHSFDDPGQRRQSVPANAAAFDDAAGKATAFMRERLGAP